jgi:hypothetical protein
MKNVYACLLAFVLFVFSVNIAEARSGCCSHHGGVCGCGCCDGTSLSTTCAPYYPQCNGPISTPKPTPKPTIVPTPKPSLKPTITPTPTPKPTVSPSPQAPIVPTSTPTVLGSSTSVSGSSNWTTAIVASLLGVGAYRLVTKGKTKAS